MYYILRGMPLPARYRLHRSRVVHDSHRPYTHAAQEIYYPAVKQQGRVECQVAYERAPYPRDR